MTRNSFTTYTGVSYTTVYVNMELFHRLVLFYNYCPLDRSRPSVTKCVHYDRAHAHVRAPAAPGSSFMRVVIYRQLPRISVSFYCCACARDLLQREDDATVISSTWTRRLIRRTLKELKKNGVNLTYYFFAILT